MSFSNWYRRHRKLKGYEIAVNWIKLGHDVNNDRRHHELGVLHSLRERFFEYRLDDLLKSRNLFKGGHFKLWMVVKNYVSVTSKYISREDFMACFVQLSHKEIQLMLTFMVEHLVFVVRKGPTTTLKQPIIFLRWTFPPIGWVKLNTDGSYRMTKDGMKAGCGGIFRSSSGESILFFTMQVPSRYGPFGTELLAVYYGLVKALEMGVEYLIIESDCKDLVEVLRHSKHPPNELKVIFSVILDILKMLRENYVQHIYREGNQVADMLAYIGSFDGNESGAYDEHIRYLVERDKTQIYFRVVQDHNLCLPSQTEATVSG